TPVCNLLASGKICEEARPFVMGASLSALLKKDGGIRPIACGDVFRRDTGRALTHSIREKAFKFFAPNQMGVAAPKGAEAVIHSWREFMSRYRDDPSKVILKVDLENAYNNGDRTAILQEVKEHFPEL